VLGEVVGAGGGVPALELEVVHAQDGLAVGEGELWAGGEADHAVGVGEEGGTEGSGSGRSEGCATLGLPYRRPVLPGLESLYSTSVSNPGLTR
jgi:hypothetical protein